MHSVINVFRTTNITERANKEINRRSKVVGAFPNQESVSRHVVSIPIDTNEERIPGNRHIVMEQESKVRS
ncbi:transposase [Methanosarcina acetivorans]|uniref:Transposase, mutator family domain n=1 Tax=Methanosarcina acetivorans (strain ATCC 35395 / DSM 2834 / JCM 12185 / C2A) TaxID=188937 RepID=Q8TM96_METAC|nr:transposase [Methanosarcina acetivorans]AAM06148.1 transposase, mutator family domain [Methanosarcina acetivorans C2A]